MKIRTKILVTFLAAFLATMALIIGLAYRLSGAASEAMVTTRLQRLAREFGSRADVRLQDRIGELEDWSQRSDIPPQIIVGDADGVVTESLRELFGRGGFVVGIDCLDRVGKVIASTDRSQIGQQHAGEAWLQTALKGEVYVGELHPVAGQNGQSIRIARPITVEPARRVVGVVTAELDWEVVLALLNVFEDEERSDGFQTTELLVTNEDGLIQASHNRGEILKDTLGQNYGIRPRDLIADTRAQRKVIDQLTDRQALLVLSRCSGTGYLGRRHWVVAARQSTDEAFASSHALVLWVSLLGMAITVVLGTAGAVVLGRMVSPIERYASFAEQLGRGEMGEALLLTGEDDLAALGRSLNQMRDNVIQRAEELQRRAIDLEFQDWSKQQINLLSIKLQSADSLVAAAQIAVAEIAPLVHAQLGAIYIRESLVRHQGRAHVLELLGGFGLGSPAGAETTIPVGFGLVGQCAQLGRRMEVQNVPADYIRIRSGLGSAVPASLVLAPVMQEGQLIGVVELGAYTPFRPELLVLLDQLLMTLGIVLENLGARARTERMLAESRELGEKLREQSETLAQSSRYKSEFLTNMSHELRTPLNSLLILSSLLGKNKTGNLTGQQVDYAATINSAGTELLNLINQILDLSKIEAGKMPVSIATFRLKDLKGSLEATFRPLADERGLELDIKIDPGVPLTMVSDQTLMQQILKNLLSNAFKFTKHGKVSVRIGREPVGARSLFFAVEDTGIGIPAEKFDLIFEAFQQADGTTSRKYGGTGLGLSISKELARLLGGHITITSELNQGSTFTLFLPPEFDLAATEAPAAPIVAIVRPQKAPEPAEPVPTVSSHHPDRTLLIIEDDAAFANLLAKLGRERGYKILVAAAADTGLSLAYRYKPDAIFLDINLPRPDGTSVLDGWGVLERVKSFPDTRHIPVHIISVLKDLEPGLKLGAVEVSSKPVSANDLQSLFTRLEQFLERAPGRLLLFEPEGPESRSIRAQLEHTDIVITTVHTAAAARDELERSHYTCLVINAEAALRGEAEVLSALVAHPQFRHLPTLVFTGRELDASERLQLQRFARYLVIHHASSVERLQADASVFLHRVERQLPTALQSPQGRLPEGARSVANETVIVVDDDERNVFALGETLKSEGMNVLIARNGKECLKLLAARPKVDVVLMDTMMPEMDGHECTRQIRMLPEYLTLPIIAVTAKAMLGDRQACLDAGANDYLTKPVDGTALLNQIRMWVYLCPQLHERRAA